MATATAIYALTKPATSDPALIGDINTNMDAVDTQLARVGYKGSDIASAGTLTLPATGSVFDVTGTTTITAISTRTAGECILLQFDGVVGITHNASTLKLLAGANYTTGAGDILGFVSEGAGNWRQYLGSLVFDVTAPTSDTFGTAATAAAAGSAATPAHRDHVHGFPAAFDATVPVTQAFGDAAAAGAAAVAARRDHRHGMPSSTLTSGTQDVTTSETTTSTSFTDLATSGPAITLSPGATRTHLIEISADTINSTTAQLVRISVAIAGAAAADVDGAVQQLGAGGGVVVTINRSVHAASQASGATHTMKYRVGGGTGTFSNRRIIGVAL